MKNYAVRADDRRKTRSGGEGHAAAADHPWKQHPWREGSPFQRPRGCARVQDLKAAHRRVKARREK